MTLTYQIPGYPTVILSENGYQVTLRPMEPGDADALLAFFQRVPEEDRAYLKDDVTSPEVIREWAKNLNYNRVLPILAEVEGRIVADGTLHRRRPYARRHLAEVRIVVDPGYRNEGIGRNLLHKLTEIAQEQQIEKVLFEVVAGKEEPARRAATILGFSPEAVLPEHVKDLNGVSHDLIVMALDVNKVLGPRVLEWF